MEIAEILVKAAQFILSLSLLIVLHEFGHFLPAKLFNTKVEKFYLFFDPWFSLFKKKIGDTEYGIGWLPLGGYVKIAGMVDESMDKEQLKEEPKPWEFRTKPAWQRLIIMIGGVTVNVILAILIYAGTLYYWGEEYLPTENAQWGIAVDSTGEKIGFQDGDKILKVDGKRIERFNKVPMEILLGSEKVLVERNGKEVTIEISSKDIKEIINNQRFMRLRFPYVIGGFSEESVAKAAGMQEGDQVIAFNGQPMKFFDEYFEHIPQHKEQEITLNALREGDTLQFSMIVPKEGKIGVAPKILPEWFKTKKYKYGLLESIPAGVNKSITTLKDYIRQFDIIFDTETEAYKSVGGFISIGSQFPSHWDWEFFWGFTAFLSIMLAFLNILPIPALDGGHVVFVLWEMVTGRKPSEKVLEYAQIVGFVILLALLLFANGQDVMRLFK
jgi:regulator of sigma E protease